MNRLSQFIVVGVVALAVIAMGFVVVRANGSLYDSQPINIENIENVNLVTNTLPELDSDGEFIIGTEAIGGTTTLDTLLLNYFLDVTDDSFFRGTTTLQEIKLGSRYYEALAFTAGNTTTPGAVASIENTGARKICRQVELDISNAPEDAYVFRVGTSSAATTWGDQHLIASTTVATSTATLITEVSNPGDFYTFNDVSGAASTTSWIWDNGVFVNVAFDASGAPDHASSSAYTVDAAGAIYLDCHTE